MAETINANVNDFANELSELIGQKIGLDHIHPSTSGRYYYTPAPKVGKPILLHHYRGPFFVDIHEEDFEKLSNGKIKAHEYITYANWQVGYYWAGGSMISGGYCQPLDIVKNNAEIRRYLQILKCRGNYRSSGYMPSEEDCSACPLKDCPLSERNVLKWDSEIQESDPRLELFESLGRRFEHENPGYYLQGFMSNDKVPENEIWLKPNGTYYSENLPAFTAYASTSLISALLMHEIEPGNFTDYANRFKFKIYKSSTEIYDVTTEVLEKAHKEQYYPQKKSIFKKIFKIVSKF